MTELRVPPHSVEAEKRLLGSALLDPSVIDMVWDLDLKTGAIYVEAHRQIWAAMVKLRKDRAPIDSVTVAAALEDSGAFRSFGGVAALVSLTDTVPSAIAYEGAVDVIRAHAARRSMLDLGHRLIEQSQKPAPSIGPIYERFVEITDGLVRVKPSPRQLHISSVVDDLKERLRDVHKGDGNAPYIPTPWKRINRLIDGWRVDHINTIGAEQKGGKTSLAMQAAVWHARQGDGVVVSTLEMPAWQLLGRSARREVARGISEGDMWNPPAEKVTDVAKVYDMLEELRELPIRFVPSAQNQRQRIDQILADIDLAIDSSPVPVRIVVLDYWQIAKPVHRYSKRPDLEHADNSARLLEWASSSGGIALLVLAQLNASDKPPRVNDLSHSKRLGKDAGTTTLIHRPNKDKKGIQTEACDLIIPSDGIRFGKGGVVPCFYDGPNMRFLEEDPNPAPYEPF